MAEASAITGWVLAVQAWAALAWLATLALAGFFGFMAWMARAPLTAARRWLRWSLYPAVVWLLTMAVLHLVR